MDSLFPVKMINIDFASTELYWCVIDSQCQTFAYYKKLIKSLLDIFYNLCQTKDTPSSYHSLYS